MRTVIIHGQSHKGSTYHIAHDIAEKTGGEIKEFFLPKDFDAMCCGCTKCFFEGEDKCPHFKKLLPITKAIDEADVIILASPVYVFHATGAMKAMLDHFGYRWMPHRPAKEMFGKRAVIITQCLGAGGKSAAKDIKDSLSWWGISSIRVISFKLMSEVRWDKIPEKKRDKMTAKLVNAAGRVKRTDFSKPGKTGLATRFKFYAVRMLQTGLGKDNPEYTDYKYWKEHGWIDNNRPWK